VKNLRKSVMKKIKKLLENNPKEESLSSIFKPLNEIEEKVTVRYSFLTDKIMTLKDEKTVIDNIIKNYEEEIKRCNQYLDSISKFGDV